MKILVTGNYDGSYNRTKILLSGLRKRTDIELQEFPFSVKQPNKSDLDNADFIFLPSFTHADVKKVANNTQTRIAFDPLISKYLTKVFDYKQVSRYSPRALKNYLKDYRAMQNADILFADTQAHANYFEKTFKVSASKIHVLPIGVNRKESSIKNTNNSEEKIIGFYGGFIPLQGTEIIIKTAKLLESHSNIKFELIGDGFEFEKMKKLASKMDLKNLIFRGWAQQDELDEAMNHFDICLGIFGSSIKSNLVIPNKLYHYAAKGIPFISKESPAVKELFTNNENCLMCKADPKSLSDSILQLINSQELADKIGANAQKLILEDYNEDVIAEKFIQALKMH